MWIFWQVKKSSPLGRVVQVGLSHGSRTEKNRESRITDIEISLSRITKISKWDTLSNRLILYQKGCLKKEKSRKATLRFLCKSLIKSPLIDDSNHSEDSCLSKSRRIKWQNHKYRGIIQVLHGSLKTFRTRITKSNFRNSRFTENEISYSRVTSHENTSVPPSLGNSY